MHSLPAPAVRSPAATRSGTGTNAIDALFTSTSAVCVTGKVVVDTVLHWSPFGQAVILVLIQAGGFGFMTSATLFLLAFGKRIGLRERLLIGESMGMEQSGGLLSIVKKMALFTLIVESAGALIFLIHFSNEAPWGQAIWQSIFHSVSAFNNAGFDLFGNFQSMTGLTSSPLMILTTAASVILGSTSFIVIADVVKKRGWLRLTLNTKIVLTVTLGLLAAGTAIILLSEYDNPATIGGMTIADKVMNAFFLAASRTSGFSTFDMAALTDYALLVMMVLMFIGGAAGSTAGGIKVTTFGVLMSSVLSTVRGRQQAGAFSRRYPPHQVHRALAVTVLAAAVVAAVALVLSFTEIQSFRHILFDTISAFGTVGLSTGITRALSTAGRIIIIVTMITGRLGPLALALTLIRRQPYERYTYPEESVRIG